MPLLALLVARNLLIPWRELTSKNLIEDSEGARVIHSEKKIPLIVVNSDGGYNYASTSQADLTLVVVEEVRAGETNNKHNKNKNTCNGQRSS